MTLPAQTGDPCYFRGSCSVQGTPRAVEKSRDDGACPYSVCLTPVVEALEPPLPGRGGCPAASRSLSTGPRRGLNPRPDLHPPLLPSVAALARPHRRRSPVQPHRPRRRPPPVRPLLFTRFPAVRGLPERLRLRPSPDRAHRRAVQLHRCRHRLLPHVRVRHLRAPVPPHAALPLDRALRTLGTLPPREPGLPAAASAAWRVARVRTFCQRQRG